MHDHPSVGNLRRLGLLVSALMVLIGCQSAQPAGGPEEGVLLAPPTPVISGASATVAQMTPVAPSAVRQPAGDVALYQDPSHPVEARVKDLLARMTTEEKIGQMTQPTFSSVDPNTIANLSIGSVLAGGDGNGVHIL